MGDLQGYLEQQQHQKKLEQQRLEKEMLEKERLNQIKNKGKDEESMSDLWFTPYIPTGVLQFMLCHLHLCLWWHKRKMLHV